MSILAWLGRQGARAIAALVFIGILVPPAGAFLKHYVTEAIFLLLVISFMRVDLTALREQLKRPTVVLLATGWTTIAVPVIFGLSCLAIGLNKNMPDLFLGLMLQAVASPMMATPALAAVMGLDATLVLIVLVTSTALVPLTAPLLAYVFFGAALSLSPTALGLKLLVILLGSLLVALVLRWLLGTVRIERHKDEINGINIMILFVFVSAVMGNVAGGFFDNPWLIVWMTLLAFAVCFAIVAITAIVFRTAGRERALALAMMTSQRNMGLMLAATEGVLPNLTWIYFALAQLPIYTSPLLLGPIVRSKQSGTDA